MKHLRLIIFIISIIALNFQSSSAQNMECKGELTSLVNTQTAQFWGIDFLTNNGFLESLGNYSPGDFNLEFKDIGGNIVPNYFIPVLFNRSYTYQVTHLPTLQTCGGKLKIIGTLGTDPIICEGNKHFAINQTIEMWPTDFLELEGARDEWFDLKIKDASGNLVFGNNIGIPSGTKTFQATVTEKQTGNTCTTSFQVSAKNTSNATAICKSSIQLSLVPNSLTLYPYIVDNGSFDYVSLTLNRSEFFCDDVGKPIKVKLSAYDSQNIISQCICNVTVEDKIPPVVAMYNNVSVEINSFEPFIITPEMIGYYYDNCGFESVQVIPNQITCNSPNPTNVKLIVKDKSGATVSASTSVSYTVPNINTELVCKDEITVEVNPFNATKISTKLLLEGNYSCIANLLTTISYNGVVRPNEELKWEDAGKIFKGLVTDNDSGNSCFSNIVVTKTKDCSSTFLVCDTKCPDGNPGDCLSGYTNEDNLDWPCNFNIYVCEGISANKLSPEQLEIVHGVPSANVRPQIINFDCPSIFMSYSDVEVGFGSPGSQNKKVFRKWNVLDWLNGNLYEYTQVFKVFADGLAICDTLPWNTPFGTCASGHTDTDAIEWPADITVNNDQISLNALRANPSVHPNNVEPQLVQECSSAYQKTYYDVVSTIDGNTKLIERVWNVQNSVSNVTSVYRQYITLIGYNVNQVCAFTYYSEPIKDVNMGFANTDESGCATLTFDPDPLYEITPTKLGNARDGVDIMDIILLYESVLGFIELNPYQEISADINGDGKITAADLVEFRKFLDGSVNWPDDQVWQFVDKNYDYSINGSIFGAHNSIFGKDLIYGNEFVGIKKGDINGSYYLDGFVNSPTFTVIKAEDNALNNGERYETSFTSDRNQNLVAVKLEYLIKEKGITVSQVSSDLLPGFDQSKNVVITDDKIQISWGADLSIFPQGAGLRNNDVLFKFEYLSNKNSVLSNILDLNPEVQNSIKQSGIPDPANVKLYYDSKIVNGIADNSLSNLKIQPNPFVDDIQIVGLESDAKYEVSDVSGRSLLSGTVKADGVVNLSALNNGFYILNISQNDRIYISHKIIKLK